MILQQQIPRRHRRSYGTNTGLSVVECWIALFVENNLRYKKGGIPLPRTNMQIAEFMHREFSGRKMAYHSRVNTVIRLYNAGELFRGQEIPSRANRAYRYDNRGHRVPLGFKDPLG